MALGDAYDTVGANLTLADAGNQDADACGEAHAEADPSVDGAAGVFSGECLTEERRKEKDRLCKEFVLTRTSQKN